MALTYHTECNFAPLVLAAAASVTGVPLQCFPLVHWIGTWPPWNDLDGFVRLYRFCLTAGVAVYVPVLSYIYINASDQQQSTTLTSAQKGGVILVSHGRMP